MIIPTQENYERGLMLALEAKGFFAMTVEELAVKKQAYMKARTFCIENGLLEDDDMRKVRLMVSESTGTEDHFSAYIPLCEFLRRVLIRTAEEIQKQAFECTCEGKKNA